MLSYDQVKRRLRNLTGVLPMTHDMCVNSCLAYTGPWADTMECSICHEPRFLQSTPDTPRKTFLTVPIGPQLQARWSTTKSANKMKYREQRTREIFEELEKNDGKILFFTDILTGTDYLKAVHSGLIADGDIVLILSIDGTQLYRYKASDCWIWIWIIVDISPTLRYKKEYVLVGGMIPGPDKPKHLDLFLFPSLHHLAVLQKEGLTVWDASQDRLFVSRPFLFQALADGPASAQLSGLVGYHGHKGCRLYCALPGRNRPGGPHYYPALLKPIDWPMNARASHDDILISNLPKPSRDQYLANLATIEGSRNPTNYQKLRRETGICKPLILSGLPRALPLPFLCGPDIMHLILNLPSLLLDLWMKSMDVVAPDSRTTWDWAVLTGERWEEHGRAVANSKRYLPGSFDRPPRDPALKLNSGYKAWEFLLYIFGLGPGLFQGLLPDAYFSNYCLLVRGIRIIYQRNISRDELQIAHVSLRSFAKGFEDLYYQRKTSRIHFVRPCVHVICHLGEETHRIGPLGCTSQWTLERTIGNLGEEIHLHSNPFKNLEERIVRRSQVNTLTASVPELQTADAKLPQWALDLGNSFALLRPKDSASRVVSDSEATAIRIYLQSHHISVNANQEIEVIRWGRLLLPITQIARTKWKEDQKSEDDDIRIARNVKFTSTALGDQFGEVLYFAVLRQGEKRFPVAIISLYGPPNPRLLQLSHGTLLSCEADTETLVVDISAIRSVVAMVPHKPVLDGISLGERVFVVERPGLDVAVLGSREDPLDS